MDELSLEEGAVPVMVAAVADQDAVVAELDRRIRELEAAIGEMQTVRAAAAPFAAMPGRKTAVSAGAAVSACAHVDEALRSLSVEQRIAVKSGLMRAGLLN